MPLFNLSDEPIYKCDRFQTWKKMYINFVPIENLLKRLDDENPNRKEIVMTVLEKQIMKFLKSYLLLELSTNNEKEEFLIKLCKKNNLIVNEEKGKDSFPDPVKKYNKMNVEELNQLCEHKKKIDNWNTKIWNKKYAHKKHQKTILEKLKSYYTHKPYARKYLELTKVLTRVLEFKAENIKRIHKFLSYELSNHNINIAFDELINKEKVFNLLIKASLLDKDLKDLRNIYGIFFEKNKEKRSKIFKAIKEGTRSQPILLHFSGIFTVITIYLLIKIFNTSRNLGVGLIGLSLNIYLFSLSIYILNIYKINYTYLLEMAEYNRFDLSHTLFFGSLFSLFIALGCFLHQETIRYDKYLIWPLLLFPFLILIIPYGFLYERKYILQSIAKIITLNIFTKKIRLPDFLYADYYNSLAPFFGYICFYLFPDIQEKITLNVFIYIFQLHALILRIYQCVLRYFETKNKINLFNALKFVGVLSALTLSTFLDKSKTKNYILILIFRIVSSLYVLYWDLIFDWLLFSNRKALFHKYTYFFIGIFNAFLRLFPIFVFIKNYSNLVIWILFADVFRRNIWGIIRLECEHLNNINGFNDSHFSKVNTLAEFYYKNYQESTSTETETMESDCLDCNVEKDLILNNSGDHVILSSKKINDSSHIV